MADPPAGKARGSGTTPPAPPSTTIHVNPSEIRLLEGILIFLGLVVLAIAGFMAASPGRVLRPSSSEETNVGPVTLASVATAVSSSSGIPRRFGRETEGTVATVVKAASSTPTSVTRVEIQTTSKSTGSKSVPETWFAIVVGFGAVLVLAGAFYRRGLSLSGAGLSVTVTGSVDDEVKEQIASKIDALPPELAPRTAERAALIYQRALDKFLAERASGNVQVTQRVVPGQGRLRRATRLLRRETLVEVDRPERVEGGPRSLEELVTEAAQEIEQGARA
jgi:hypothetical protein